MRLIKPVIYCGAALTAALISTPSLAQEDETRGEQPETVTATLGAGQPSGTLPPPQSDDDPTPQAPGPQVSATGITEQAGVGGTQAYARAGVLELGGSAGLTLADNFTQIGFSPTIGWFFVDNLELSAIIGVNYISATVEVPDGTGGTTEEDADSTVFNLLLEPSYHLPFSDRLFGFLGVGLGMAYQEGPGAGFAVAPRLGLNVLVGRSGIFTPAITAVYQTTDAVQTPQGTVVAVGSTFGMQAGYTVMW